MYSKNTHQAGYFIGAAIGGLVVGGAAAYLLSSNHGRSTIKQASKIAASPVRIIKNATTKKHKARIKRS